MIRDLVPSAAPCGVPKHGPTVCVPKATSMQVRRMAIHMDDSAEKIMSVYDEAFI